MCGGQSSLSRPESREPLLTFRPLYNPSISSSLKKLQRPAGLLTAGPAGVLMPSVRGAAGRILAAILRAMEVLDELALWIPLPNGPLCSLNTTCIPQGKRTHILKFQFWSTCAKSNISSVLGECLHDGELHYGVGQPGSDSLVRPRRPEPQQRRRAGHR